MTDSKDDEVYRRNVRNMSFVLAAIVIVIFASIFLPPLVNPAREQFSPEVSVDSPYAFSLNLAVNATHIHPSGSISYTVWVNNTENSINTLQVQENWAASYLSGSPCSAEVPIRLGVMQGYFGENNFSLGHVLQLSYLSSSCPTIRAGTPLNFLLDPLSSEAIVRSSAGVQQLDLSVAGVSNGYFAVGSEIHFSGVLTLVAMDEWGDIVLTHITTSQP